MGEDDGFVQLGHALRIAVPENAIKKAKEPLGFRGDFRDVSSLG